MMTDNLNDLIEAIRFFNTEEGYYCTPEKDEEYLLTAEEVEGLEAFLKENYWSHVTATEHVTQGCKITLKTIGTGAAVTLS